MAETHGLTSNTLEILEAISASDPWAKMIFAPHLLHM